MDETSTTSTYAAQTRELQTSPAPGQEKVSAGEASSSSQILPRVDRPVAAEPTPSTRRVPKSKKRPKRIDGLEVRPAEPVDETIIDPPLNEPVYIPRTPR
jgi:hypothetical protein